MHGLWSVAKNTLIHALRMKVAGVFILLLAAMLIAMPFTFARYGDGTLAGQIRTFLSYGFGMAAFLLSVMTMLVAAGVTSADIEHKYVFTLSVKPLPRWQYIVGRWLGMVLLNAMLLAVATLFIYVMAQRLRATPTPLDAGNRFVAEDRRAVETEVFAARGQVTADWDFDFNRRIDGLIAADQRTGAYDRELDDLAKKIGSRPDAEAFLVGQYRQREATRLESIGPGQATSWMFRDVRLSASEKRGAGKVTAIEPNRGMVRVEASPDLLARLIYMGPVRVNAMEAIVLRVTKKDFDAGIVKEDPRVVEAFKPGTSVELTAEPTIQIRYELAPVEREGKQTYPVVWVVENPKTGLKIMFPREDPARTPQTLTVSSRYVSDAGQVRVRFTNGQVFRDGDGQPRIRSGGDIVVTRKDVSVLYPIGGFEMNLVKGSLLLLVRLMFISGLGVALGSFLSFPVACLVGFVLMAMSLAFGFLSKATEIPADVVTWEHAARVVGHYAMVIMMPLAPNFAGTSPSDALVAGTYISWISVAVVAAFTLLVHTLLTLLGGWLLFQWRELGRVQV